MATVVIALGSNLGDRQKEIMLARHFLEHLNKGQIIHAPVYETEPIGPSDTFYYNSVTQLNVSETPEELVIKLKEYERKRGREKNAPRWSARKIDLDIIAYDNMIIESEKLVIPHKNYRNRLFVLEPLRDIRPNWIDPETSETIADLLAKAPAMETGQLTKLNGEVEGESKNGSGKKSV